MKYTKQSESLPIDEVDAQTLYTVIRELHARRNLGVLRSAYAQIGEILKGDTWQDQLGADINSQTGQ